MVNRKGVEAYPYGLNYFEENVLSPLTVGIVPLKLAHTRADERPLFVL